MGLYPKNQDNQSTWGALDFDAHSGDDELAKSRSIRAFSLLAHSLKAASIGHDIPEVVTISLSLRGNGDLWPKWVGLLQDTCEAIGAPIQDGVTEIFPSERTENQDVGRGIRVPGSLNPSTGKAELIIADTIRPLLDHLASAKSRLKLHS